MRRILLLSMLLGPLLALAAPARFVSGNGRTHLLELYSSEGCSSCPPAEHWLGGLEAAPGLWRDFVPVAFHVSYWDRLGWRDRFARNSYTQREYRYAETWGSGSVYTPCFVLDGAEWRGGAGISPPERTAGPGGVLAAEYDGSVCRVRFTPAPGANLVGDVHVAVLGGGIASAVGAGENEGRTLHHEFIVLTMRDAKLADGAAELALPLPDVAGVRRRALAVWVTARGSLAALQATGGWLE
jgi:hypothetical protein